MSTKNRNARIEAANKRFMKMSKPRRRVAIARDVIAQLGTKIVATTGIYVGADELYGLQDDSKELASQLQGHLKKAESCQACALGSLFICGVIRSNDITVKQAGITYSEVDGGKAYRYLKRFFTASQLRLIETAFEENMYIGASRDARVSQAKLYDARWFVENINDAQGSDSDATELRLRLIMENIIANKGTFVPSKKPTIEIVTPGFRG